MDTDDNADLSSDAARSGGGSIGQPAGEISAGEQSGEGPSSGISRRSLLKRTAVVAGAAAAGGGGCTRDAPPLAQKNPKPKPGQKWNLHELMDKGIAFTTLIGTYLWADHGQQPPVPPPSLATLSLHFWHLKDEADYQKPHQEDEAYFVIKGSGRITVAGQVSPLQPGDLIFVPKSTEHRFHDFEKDGLDILVIFGPNFTG